MNMAITIAAHIAPFYGTEIYFYRSFFIHCNFKLQQYLCKTSYPFIFLTQCTNLFTLAPEWLIFFFSHHYILGPKQETQPICYRFWYLPSISIIFVRGGGGSGE